MSKPDKTKYKTANAKTVKYGRPMYQVEQRNEIVGLIWGRWNLGTYDINQAYRWMQGYRAKHPNLKFRISVTQVVKL